MQKSCCSTGHNTNFQQQTCVQRVCTLKVSGTALLQWRCKDFYIFLEKFKVNFRWFKDIKKMSVELASFTADFILTCCKMHPISNLQSLMQPIFKGLHPTSLTGKSEKGGESWLKLKLFANLDTFKCVQFLVRVQTTRCVSPHHNMWPLTWCKADASAVHCSVCGLEYASCVKQV